MHRVSPDLHHIHNCRRRFAGQHSGNVRQDPESPQYVAADRAGDLFFVDQNVVLRLDTATRLLTLYAGNGTTGFSGDNGPAIAAQFSSVSGVAVDVASNVYIADYGNNRIRRVSNGVITTIAGNGTQGFSGDGGPAISARLYDPEDLTVDSSGNLYIADIGNNRIRKVSNGVITTVAGNGMGGFSGDNGPATNAGLSGRGMAVDSAGALYIADSGNFRIRKVSTGVITTVAGNGAQGFSGDNRPATSAQLNGPADVAVDSTGNLYIADPGNRRIRKVSNGVITTIVGGGLLLGDNASAMSAELLVPLGVALDSAGNIYIADPGYNLIREVSGGVIVTVVGNGVRSFSGDNGAATSAQLYQPGGSAPDSVGNLYIADDVNNRIRKV
jgi:sugar lactone lactonase YvrE